MQKTVLVVEDEAALQKIIVRQVKKLGHRVLKASDGEEALEVIAKEKPDLILLDVVMPKKNGFDVNVEVKLKQYRDYGTKTVNVTIKQSKPVATVQNTRPAESSPAPKVTPKTHKVVKGDTLWGIAKKYYGNGSQYMKIYNANTNILKNPNVIYVGQVLTIPV